MADMIIKNNCEKVLRSKAAFSLLAGIISCVLCFGSVFSARILPAAAEPLRQETEEEPAETEPVPEPEAPVPTGPSGFRDSTAMGFYWEPSANADYYEITWHNDKGGEGILQRKSDDWTCQMGGCILYTELPGSADYTWTVKAVNDAGSAESEEMKFTLKAKLTGPRPYRPASTLNNQSKIIFEWQDTTREGASLFRIQAGNSEDGRICLDRWFDRSEMFVGNGVCSMSTDIYFPIGDYRWRVKASDGSSESDWSGWTDFSVGCPDCLAGTYTNSVTAGFYPLGAGIDLSPYFSWRAVTGASSYLLRIADANGAELLSEEVSLDNCTFERCAYKPELSLTPGTTGTWSVTTYGANHISWGRDEETFSIEAPALMNEISFVGPEDHGSLDPKNQQIIWTDPGSGTASFRLGIVDAAGETLFLGELSRREAWCDGTTCSIQFRSIPAGENYIALLTPFSEYNIPGTSIAITFSNPSE